MGAAGIARIDTLSGVYVALSQRISLHVATVVAVPASTPLFDLAAVAVFPLSGQQGFRIVSSTGNLLDPNATGKITTSCFAVITSNVIGPELVECDPCNQTMGLPLGDIGLFIHGEVTPIYLWNDWLQQGGLSDGGQMQIAANATVGNSDIAAGTAVLNLDALVEIYQVSTGPPVQKDGGFGFPRSGQHSGQLSGT